MIEVKAPRKIDARFLLPASKSISNRLLIINALSDSPRTIENLSEADDTLLLQAALADGKSVVDVGAAGTAMRFSAAYFAAHSGSNVLLTGSERMCRRPIGILVESLRALGAQIEYAGEEGFPPLQIQGHPLAGGILSINSGVSSQFISALLMVAPTLEHGLRLRLAGEKVSQPYIDLTLQLMRRCGVQADWLPDGSTIVIPPAAYSLPPRLCVEADWSAASYAFEIAALCRDAQIVMPGLEPDSLQGDSRVAQIFEPLGVQSRFTADGLSIRSTGSHAPRLDFNFKDQPDLVQTVVVTCCLLQMPFHFTGVYNLALKETDRLSALRCELAKLGYAIETGTDHIAWDGSRCPAQPAPRIATYKDHRMAMAFAPASLRTASILVEEEEVVSKSFPRYWEQLQNLGFTFNRTTEK